MSCSLLSISTFNTPTQVDNRFKYLALKMTTINFMSYLKIASKNYIVIAIQKHTNFTLK